MRTSPGQRLLIVACWVSFHAVLSLAAAGTFRVATYNLNNYTDETVGARLAKTDAGRAKVRESIAALTAEVVALQEMGGARPFEELRRALKTEGADYPHAQLLFARDTNIQVAVLSKFPITACRQHTNDSYLLMGRRHYVQRGILEVRLQVNSNYSFTALIVHLKSRRQAVEADEAEMRLQEAIILREKIDALLKAEPQANLVVLGDFNDAKDSKPVRAIIGRYREVLLDTRPAERNGDDQPASNPRWDPPRVAWTYFYGREDSFDRIDYILLSPGMAREWLRQDTWVLALPNWGVASDHRPIVAGFLAEDQ
jgi:endonuclease/exonuclease/phosphatase family metal-dependent hydrolase